MGIRRISVRVCPRELSHAYQMTGRSDRARKKTWHAQGRSRGKEIHFTHHARVHLNIKDKYWNCHTRATGEIDTATKISILLFITSQNTIGEILDVCVVLIWRRAYARVREKIYKGDNSLPVHLRYLVIETNEMNRARVPLVYYFILFALAIVECNNSLEKSWRPRRTSDCNRFTEKTMKTHDWIITNGTCLINWRLTPADMHVTKFVALMVFQPSRSCHERAR